jgi:hypothetical protein
MGHGCPQFTSVVDGPPRNPTRIYLVLRRDFILACIGGVLAPPASAWALPRRWDDDDRLYHQMVADMGEVAKIQRWKLTPQPIRSFIQRSVRERGDLVGLVLEWYVDGGPDWSNAVRYAVVRARDEAKRIQGVWLQRYKIPMCTSEHGQSNGDTEIAMT